MNTKFSFALLVIVIAVIATACAPIIVDTSAPLIQAAPLADNETTAILPVTGESASATVRTPQASRLQSGEIFLSEDNGPDHLQNFQPAMNETPQNICISEDSQPRPQSGCVE